MKTFVVTEGFQKSLEKLLKEGRPHSRAFSSEHWDKVDFLQVHLRKVIVPDDAAAGFICRNLLILLGFLKRPSTLESELSVDPECTEILSDLRQARSSKNWNGLYSKYEPILDNIVYWAFELHKLDILVERGGNTYESFEKARVGAQEDQKSPFSLLLRRIGLRTPKDRDGAKNCTINGLLDRERTIWYCEEDDSPKEHQSCSNVFCELPQSLREDQDVAQKSETSCEHAVPTTEREMRITNQTPDEAVKDDFDVSARSLQSEKEDMPSGNWEFEEPSVVEIHSGSNLLREREVEEYQHQNLNSFRPAGSHDDSDDKEEDLSEITPMNVSPKVGGPSERGQEVEDEEVVAVDNSFRLADPDDDGDVKKEDLSAEMEKIGLTVRLNGLIRNITFQEIPAVEIHSGRNDGEIGSDHLKDQEVGLHRICNSFRSAGSHDDGDDKEKHLSEITPINDNPEVAILPERDQEVEDKEVAAVDDSFRFPDSHDDCNDEEKDLSAGTENETPAVEIHSSRNDEQIGSDILEDQEQICMQSLGDIQHALAMERLAQELQTELASQNRQQERKIQRIQMQRQMNQEESKIMRHGRTSRRKMILSILVKHPIVVFYTTFEIKKVNRTTEILNRKSVPYVLEKVDYDVEIRLGVKEYTGKGDFPQVLVDGKLVEVGELEAFMDNLGNK